MKSIVKKEEKSEKYIIIFGCIIFIIIQAIQIGQFKFYVQSDDFGYIANSAFFAGYNWNPYTGNMTPYYNIGFSIFTTWAFRIFDNPMTIYRAFLFFIVFVQILLMIVVYNIAVKHLNMDRKHATLVGLMCTLGTMSPQSGLYFMAEVPYTLSFMLMIYLVLEAKESSGKKDSFIRIVCGSCCL